MGALWIKTYQIYLVINIAIYIIVFLTISRKWKESVMRSMVDSLKRKNIDKLSVDDVAKSVNRLKLGKSDGEEGLSSDHIINGAHMLTVLLTSVLIVS